MKTTHSSAGAVCIAMLLASSAPAQTVLFDFGTDATFRGLSTNNPDNNGLFWNNIPVGTFEEDLVDIDNNPTIIDFGFSTGVGTDSFNGPAGATSTLTLTDDVQLVPDVIDEVALGNLGGSPEAAFDFVTNSGPGAPLRFVIQGLDPNKTYDLTFFGSHIFSADTTTVYTAYTDNTYTTVADSVQLDVQDPIDTFIPNGDTVATLTGLVPSAANLFLNLEISGLTGQFGYLNAMQLVGVDNPNLLGDADGDGDVDGDDLIAVQTQFGSTGASPLLGDADSDGDVDGDDLIAVQTQFGNTLSVAVPEPSAVSLLALVAAGAVAAKGRTRA